MKNQILIIFLIAFVFKTTFSQQVNIGGLKPFEGKDIHLGGYAGTKIDLCINERIKKQDVAHLIEPFRQKNETRCWQSEFWGKWMIGAVDAYKYESDKELFAIMESSVFDLIGTQLTNGYIGNYPPKNQLTHWDIWGRKYSMLGLISFYEISNEKKALQSAMRIADNLLTQVGLGKVNIVKTGNYRGMASSSVLEPIVYLYKYTGEQRYLDFAMYIIRQWETGDGPELISKALEGVQVSERFPHPDVWWSWHNGQKAYEMMSCYDGLLQLYKITGEPAHFRAVEKTVESIIETEINVTGSGSAFECWYKGVENQTRPTYHNMETCVTVTWMKLCYNMLKITGNPIYADQIEKTFFNSLLGSMKYDGKQIAKYTPLEGVRQEGKGQCRMHINCCNANGPRGFVMMPEFSVMNSDNGICVNYYGEMTANIDYKGNRLGIKQHTSYPETGKIILSVDPERKGVFAISLRIPSWSKENSITVNGEKIDEIFPSTYKTINREWQKGDLIEINFDMRGRLIEQDTHQAIIRGPLVLARDSRLGNPYVDEPAIVQSNSGYVDLTPVSKKPEDVWMAFTAPVFLDTDMESDYGKLQQVQFCDFASAGNLWERNNRYKVWLKKTLNVMKSEYGGY